MPMTRRALLIVNPGEQGATNYCKGVYVDSRNYFRLLTSAPGGAWQAQEVTVLDRPSATSVLTWVRLHSKSDYRFMMFSGHGCYSDAECDQVLELRDGEEIAASELLMGGGRRTLILDCCQEVYPVPLIEERETKLAAAVKRRIPDPAVCRRLYDEAVAGAPQSHIVITSCAKGEVSTDDDVRGGLYNGSIIAVADNWTRAQESALYPEQVLFLPDAHEDAAATTRRLSGGTQNPTIAKPRTAPYFPLCVFG